MLSLRKFLDSYDEILFIIKDSEGNIIYPCDRYRLGIIQNILNSRNDENGFYVNNDNFYEVTTQVIIDNEILYIVETIKNVTKYEKENIEALTDVVTNLDGKRLTYEKFNAFISSSMLLERPFACVMADADLFKNVNDTYGHKCGDEMLKSLGIMLRKNTRQKNLKGTHVYSGRDIVGRIGGEEFLILLNDVSLISSYNIINKIRKEIETSAILYEDRLIPSCTMSFGIYYVDEEALKQYKTEDTTVDEIRDTMLKKCDDALYESKKNGRNCINVYGINNSEELNKILFTKRKVINKL